MDEIPISTEFSFEEAFVRNIGWVTEGEQQILRDRKVAIAGLGGVGGIHLLTLTRLGVGAFHIADSDEFEMVNFNRQIGAMVSTVGRPKVEVLAEMARDVNPELQLTSFHSGVNTTNIDDFLDGVDLFVDGLDFFVLDIRARIFASCAERGIPAITAAPIGMGTAYLVFMPGHMTFEEYFRLEGLPLERQYVNFLVGLAPKAYHRAYLVDPSRLDLANQRGPSTAMGCDLCAGVVGSEALKILLGRGSIHPVPNYHHFDAYRYKWKRGWLPGGNRNPIQAAKCMLGYRVLGRIRKTPPTTELSTQSKVIEQILDVARWAPSGDNEQPWRFEIVNDSHVVVHGHDTREHCVYDLAGHASQIALGTLLENVALAATQHGLRADIARIRDRPETSPTFNVRFVSHRAVPPHALTRFIRHRATQRRSMHTRPLTQREKQALEQSIGDSFSIYWLEGFHNRWRVARMLFMNGKLRLTLPEAYATHRDIIEWDSRFSEDRIPDQAVGLDPVGVKLMHWALKSWDRVRILNTYFGGTLLPRVQLDLMPGINCAAHFVIVASETPRTMDDYIAAGRAWQRFWLTATRLGLRSQPEMTPLAFSSYIRDDVAFTKNERSLNLAKRVADKLADLLTVQTSERAVVMGRIGAGPAPTSRSVRLPLQRLMLDQNHNAGDVRTIESVTESI
ncbi:ThiF family adenylyltransferase [Gammaproteobacteria bacterium]|nr:ThiF family adenylyltransferase [Gammaproteobacteria bacterium]